MFINLAKPQTDTAVLSRDNVFASPAAAAALAPWCFHLNQINIAHLLGHQPPTHDMSFNKPMSLNSGWPQHPGAAKQDEPQQHGLPVYGAGHYPEEPQNTAGSVPLSTTDEHPSLAVGNRPSRSSGSSYVNVSHYPGANVAAGSELLDSPYWQLVPPGLAPASSFAAPHLHGEDPIWQPSHPSVNPVMLEYGGHCTLDVHASVLPQTVFRPGEALHDLPLAAMAEKEPASSTNSKLYASSGMLEGVEAMVLSDEPGQPSSWVQPEYDCEAAVASSSTWAAEPETAESEGKTVSPKMLRLRQTPSPAASCESLRTSLIAGNAQPSQAFSVNDPVVPLLASQAPKPAASSRKSRKLLPDMAGQRLILPSSNTSRRRKSNDDPPSPPRRLMRLRPKPEQPSPAAAAAGSKGRERIDLADRMSKDDFLVRQKQLGLTYKEIRRMGGFTEAESTLRGRYRTLTKSREARVRKPEWSEKDLRLLEKAVRTLAPNTLSSSSSSSPSSVHPSSTAPAPSSAKVPWKKVAEYIVSHGGTYHFGNSTCRKRWDELVRAQAARGRGVREGWFFSDEHDNGNDSNHGDGDGDDNGGGGAGDGRGGKGGDNGGGGIGGGGATGTGFMTGRSWEVAGGGFAQGYHTGYGQGM
ncbi:hypothetical protein C8A03DRAFT_32969 [Achaetomium macrosporum]|uniref:Myb-like domain-containing protein n=1 Tax=Achaetomium macrosporum TaxID=79813 RepID=A0AAN7HEK5_9PEZI|nr:hypothetical protein C8A03DRAFT_32969 [Achaetomium macrosporum]